MGNFQGCAPDRSSIVARPPPRPPAALRPADDADGALSPGSTRERQRVAEAAMAATAARCRRMDAESTLLLHYGYDADALATLRGWRDLHGRSRLARAAAAGDEREAAALLVLGAAADGDGGGAPLHLAAAAGAARVVALLLDHGADAAAADGLGRTAREAAERAGRAEVVDLLDARALLAKHADARAASPARTAAPQPSGS